jgi:hypothetical protein
MAVVTRTTSTGATHGTLYNQNAVAYVVDAGGSLAAKGGIGGALELLVEELQPLVYQSVSTSGLVYVIMDTAQGDASDLQTRVRNLGNLASTSIAYDFTGATVTLGGNITVAA